MKEKNIEHKFRVFQSLRILVYWMIAIFCFLYFIICVRYAGFRLSVIWIWPLTALFFGVRARMLTQKKKQIESEFNRTGLNNSDLINSKNQKKSYVYKIAIIGYRLLTIFLLVSFILVESCVISGMRSKPEAGLEYIIVLGAGVRGTTPTRPLLLRMQTAKEYMLANPDTLVVASGGQGVEEDISEAQCIRDYLVKNGIDANRILMEEKSTSTEENLQFSFQIIPKGKEKVGIISNGFHIYRAKWLGKRQGHNQLVGIPTKTLLPLGLHYMVREYFGIMRTWILGCVRYGRKSIF